MWRLVNVRLENTLARNVYCIFAPTSVHSYSCVMNSNELLICLMLDARFDVHCSMVVCSTFSATRARAETSVRLSIERVRGQKFRTRVE